jgi:hypothetical protein
MGIVKYHFEISAINFFLMADAHFGFLGAIAALDFPRPSMRTQELLNWKPAHPGLLADLEQGATFNLHDPEPSAVGGKTPFIFCCLFSFRHFKTV